MESPHIGIAFLAGLLSFFSPCVLAVAPGYLGILTGTVTHEGLERKKAVWATFLFILGFTIVFALLGTAFSFVGQMLRVYRTGLLRILGIVVIIFGLQQLGVLRINLLLKERRTNLGRIRTGPIKPLLTGMAFAFGWTPCVGPILGMILALAGSMGRPLAGFILLGFYSAGLAAPFFIMAISFASFSKIRSFLLKHVRWVEIFSGILLILMGLVLFFDVLSLFSQWLNQIFHGWSPEDWLDY